jgi:phage terminase large subunit
MPSDAPSWKPHPGPQTAFLRSTADECLYGGAAGGGKSFALLLEALRGVENPAYRGILLRRTYPELRKSLMDQAHKILTGLATYNVEHRSWTFPSGAQVMFGALRNDREVHRYQSAEFAYIGFDELTSFTQFQYEYMLSRNRNTAGLPNRIRAASNPGGVGHKWVKARFIDKCAPFEKRWFVRDGADEVAATPDTPSARSRNFIPARVTDNPTLMDADPGYIARLEALPQRERRMLLDGRWDVSFDGLVYDNFESTLHIVDRVDLPAEWTRIRSIDFGYNNPLVVQWWAVSGDDEMVLYRELYATRQLVSEVGPLVRDLSEGERITATVADHDAENRAELEKHGIHTVPATKTIKEGIQACRRRLEPDRETGRPRIYLFRECTLRHDPRLAATGRPTSTRDEFAVYQYPTDAGGGSSDEIPLDMDNHGMDAMRYAVMYADQIRDRRRGGPQYRWRRLEGI